MPSRRVRARGPIGRDHRASHHGPARAARPRPQVHTGLRHPVSRPDAKLPAVSSGGMKKGPDPGAERDPASRLDSMSRAALTLPTALPHRRRRTPTSDVERPRLPVPATTVRIAEAALRSNHLTRPTRTRQDRAAGTHPLQPSTAHLTARLPAPSSDQLRAPPHASAVATLPHSGRGTVARSGPPAHLLSTPRSLTSCRSTNSTSTAEQRAQRPAIAPRATAPRPSRCGAARPRRPRVHVSQAPSWGAWDGPPPGAPSHRPSQHRAGKAKAPHRGGTGTVPKGLIV